MYCIILLFFFISGLLSWLNKSVSPSAYDLYLFSCCVATLTWFSSLMRWLDTIWKAGVVLHLLRSNSYESTQAWVILAKHWGERKHHNSSLSPHWSLWDAHCKPSNNSCGLSLCQKWLLEKLPHRYSKALNTRRLHTFSFGRWQCK